MFGQEYKCDIHWNTTDACFGIDRPWAVNATDPANLTFYHWLADQVQDRSHIFSVENNDVIEIVTYEYNSPKPQSATSTICSTESYQWGLVRYTFVMHATRTLLAPVAVVGVLAF